MSLSKDAMTYELERFEKNALFIFNLDKRPDTETDVKALKKTFGKFGFEVVPVEPENLTKDGIIKAIESCKYFLYYYYPSKHHLLRLY